MAALARNPRAALVRFFWFGFTPVAAAALSMRWLLPAPGSDSGWGTLEEFTASHGAYLALGFFLLFAALIHYWRDHLPGAKLLARSTPEEAKPALGATRLAIPDGGKGVLPVVAWVAGAALLALGVRTFVTVAEVSSESMLPTLQRGDKVLLNKVAYGLELPLIGRRTTTLPKRGDLIVFRTRLGDTDLELVKRVFGLPGDRIAVRGNVPLLNGKHIPYCYASRYVYVTPEARFDGKVMVEFLDGQPHLAGYSPVAFPYDNEYVVKPGEVFVLGDNRDNSLDSRAWNQGVPLPSIVGRVDRLLIGARPSLDDFWQPIATHHARTAADHSSIDDGLALCIEGSGVVRPN